MCPPNRHAALLLAFLVLAGCVARFSPATVRDEIARQNGDEPRIAFELQLGRIATSLIQSALLDRGADADLELAGVDRLELAVYEASGARGPALDATEISARGWETTLRFLDSTRSGVVLTRSCGGRIGDLVLVGSGPRTVVYARLRGELSAELPAALGETLRADGPLAVKDALAASTAG